MAKEWAKKFYKSKAWYRTRAMVMATHSHTCQVCGDVATIVHHKIELNESNINNAMISLNQDLLMCVCHKCHNQIHYKNSNCREGYWFDTEGNLHNVSELEG